MSFYTEIIQGSADFDSPDRIDDLALLEPVTQAAIERIVASAAQRGVQLMVFETYRSQARQTELYNQGATQLKTVGVHHYGLACDLVKSIHGQPSWKGDFTFLKELAEANGLIWGGDWGNGTIHHSFVDAVHVQRINVADQGKLFNLSWYPDASYLPVVV